MENSQENQNRPWTWEENKAFEVELARIPHGIPDRWTRIADALPGRSPREVELPFADLLDDIVGIFAGVVKPPNYTDYLAIGDVAPEARAGMKRKKMEQTSSSMQNDNGEGHSGNFNREGTAGSNKQVNPNETKDQKD